MSKAIFTFNPTSTAAAAAATTTIASSQPIHGMAVLAVEGYNDSES